MSATIPGSFPTPPEMMAMPVMATPIMDTPLAIVFHDVPPKSRTETLIRLRCSITAATPGQFRHLHIPDLLLASERWLRPREGFLQTLSSSPALLSDAAGDASITDDLDLAQFSPGDLWLSADVMCASDLNKRTRCCQACLSREHKKLARQGPLVPPTTPTAATEDAAGTAAAATETGTAAARKRPAVVLGPALRAPTADLAMCDRKMLLVHAHPIVPISSGEFVLPARIPCYTRHHDEKLGFIVRFSLLDGPNGRVVAQGESSPILMTDDHKSANKKKRRQEAEMDDGKIDLDGTTEPPSPSSSSVSVSASPQPAKRARGADTAPCMPLSPGMYGSVAPLLGLPTPTASPPSSGLLSSSFLTDGFGLNPLALFGATISPPALTLPKIERVIPFEGPVHGGIEVTVLGQNFTESLAVCFGGILATNTVYWSANTLICTLPPSPSAGSVPVCIKQMLDLDLADRSLPVTFTYKDDTDKALMELALQLIGFNLLQSFSTPRDVANRIIQGYAPTQPQTQQQQQQQQQQQSPPYGSFFSMAAAAAAPTWPPSKPAVPFSAAEFAALLPESMPLEEKVMCAIHVAAAMVDPEYVPGTSELPERVVDSLQSVSWLARAGRANMPRLVTFLVDAAKCDPHARDACGYTALDHAAAAKSVDAATCLLRAMAVMSPVTPTTTDYATAIFSDGGLAMLRGKLSPPSSPVLAAAAAAAGARAMSLTGLHVHARLIRLLGRPEASLFKRVFAFIVLLSVVQSLLSRVESVDDFMPWKFPSAREDWQRQLAASWREPNGDTTRHVKVEDIWQLLQ
ncbi:hypothetical protein BC828DRAFT_389513 [Blastocladiella britannica]|nr:hypothetical protein BC828DRAFT_389513 [Blastocladiella britannica]